MQVVQYRFPGISAVLAGFGSLLVLLLGVATSQSAGAATLNSYSIGNSLTWDANPPKIAAMAAQAGFTQSVGYHICCGQSLTYISQHPSETCVTPTSYGTFDSALTGYGWDAVTLQPYPGTTAVAERQALVSLINTALNNSANQNAQFYIYAAYPSQDLGAGGSTSIDFQAKWNQTFAPGGSAATVLSRPFFDWLIDGVRQDTSATLAQPVRMIPVGDVIARVDQLAQAGQIPGIGQAHDLYRDQNHLNNVGRFLAATTFFATLYGTDPQGMAVPSGLYVPGADVGDQTITPELAGALQAATWKVVSSHPYTGVPEPSMSLLALGGLFALLARRATRGRA